MSLTDEQRKDIQSKMEWEGVDYYLFDYISSEYLKREYDDKKLVKLYRKLLKAKKELLDYIGLQK